MITWFYAAQVSLENGNRVAKVDSSESLANINPADALIVGASSAMYFGEIVRAYSTNEGNFIELAKPWPHATQTAASYVLPTAGNFNAAVKALNDANQLVHDNYQAMLDWQTKAGSVTFKDLDGNTHSVKTLKQRMSELEQIHPFPWAMRKVEFEARRQQNLEKYEASGFVHMGKHYNNDVVESVGEGLYIYTYEQYLRQEFYLGSDSTTQSRNAGTSESNTPVLNIAGVLTEIKFLNTNNAIFNCQIELPPAEDGTRTYDSATGISVRHTTPALAFAAETATNKVVTDRQDGYGFLQIKQEINDYYPFVYEHGLPQSFATHINGVPTVTNNTQPIEYFAQFEGDTTSRGRGVNWQTASDEERVIIASDPANKIEFDDVTGKFYQTHNFILTWAGAGNGDWQNIDAITGDLQFDTFNKIAPAISNASKFTAGKYKGVFTADNNADCHILFCGTVNRLNQGAYHPSFNRYGAAAFAWLNNPTTGQVTWSDTGNGLARKPTNSHMCFVSFDDGGSKTGLTGSGSIGVGYSGRPDGRYYDAIYASGQGGVCRDMRFKADGLSLTELAEHDLKVKSGEYRGIEKLQLIKIYPHNGNTGVTSASFPGHQYTGFWTSQLAVKSTEHYFVVNVDTLEVFDSRSINIQLTVSATKNLYWPSSWGSLPNMRVIRTHETNLSVAGEYLHTDVIGNPENILLCDDLKDGWIGGWSPDLPDGTNNIKRLTRPVFSSDGTSCQYYNVASGWASTTGAHNLSELTSTVNHSTVFADGNVAIVNYMAKAKMTRSSDNLKILGGYTGIGSVFCCSFYASTYGFEWGKGLAYSLSDVILVSNNSSGNLYSYLSLNDVQLRPDTNSLDETPFRKHAHQPISIVGGAPINGIARKGLKALDYVTEINGQAFICYAYAELVYDSVAGNWGDDGQVHIVDGQSDMPDLNGHTVKVGTAIIVEPLGWVKNAA